MAGRTCVTCPWHRHQITLDTGESLYTAIDPKDLTKMRPGCTKGIKQRTHKAKISNGDVFVQLSDLSKPIESDQYFTDKYKSMRENTLKEPILQNRLSLANSVPIHSVRSFLKK